MLQRLRNLFGVLEPRDRLRFGVLVTLRAFGQVPELFALLALGLVIAQLGNGSVAEASVRGLFSWIPELPVLQLATISASLFLLKVVILLLTLRSLTNFLAGLDSRMSEKIVEGAAKSDLSDLKRVSQGELGWSIGLSSHVAFNGVPYAFSSLVSEVFLATIIVVSLFIVEPGFTSTALAGMVLFFMLVTRFIGARLKDIGERTSAIQVGIADFARDLVTNFKSLKFGEFSPISPHFNEARREFAKLKSSQSFLMSVPRQFAELVVVFVFLSVLVAQEVGFLGGEASSASVTLIAVGGLRLLAAALPIQTSINNLKALMPQTTFAVDMVSRVGKQKPVETRGSQLGSSDLDLPISVSVDNLTLRLANHPDTILRKVSLSISPGEFVGILGPSGSGKTSLLDCISGLHPDVEGNIYFNDRDIKRLNEKDWAQVSYLPQRVNLLGGTLMSNIVLGWPEIRLNSERLQWAIETVGLQPLINSLEFGIDTDVGKHRDSFSGGQIQRVALARVLYSRPRLLLLDEPTTGLDSLSETLISHGLTSLKGFCTIVMVSHSAQVVEGADSKYWLEDGRIDPLR